MTSKLENLDIRNKYGEFHAVELVTPGCKKTFDILAVVLETEHDDEESLDAPDLTIIDYIWGVSVMSDEDIEIYFIETVEDYCRKKEANSK